MTIQLLLAMAAAVCFTLAALGVSSRLGLVPLGLLFLTLMLIL